MEIGVARERGETLVACSCRVRLSWSKASSRAALIAERPSCSSVNSRAACRCCAFTRRTFSWACCCVMSEWFRQNGPICKQTRTKIHTYMYLLTCINTTMKCLWNKHEIICIPFVLRSLPPPSPLCFTHTWSNLILSNSTLISNSWF